MPIGNQLNGPILICAQGVHAVCLHALQEFRTGVTVEVFLASGNNGDLWVHLFQKFRHGRVFAAVVSDFQDIGVQFDRSVFRKDGILRLPFGISGEQNASIFVLQAEDQGVVVFRAGSNLLRRDLRPQEIHADAVPIEGLGAKFVLNPHVFAPGDFL